jgi:NAD(P)-dependent dehydrogenase (short-subunit alcohol dehydrogenase family)/acyl carrier protein
MQRSNLRLIDESGRVLVVVTGMELRKSSGLQATTVSLRGSIWSVEWESIGGVCETELQAAAEQSPLILTLSWNDATAGGLSLPYRPIGTVEAGWLEEKRWEFIVVLAATGDSGSHCPVTVMLHDILRLLDLAKYGATPIWIVTRGAQHVSPTHLVEEPRLAAIWGLAKTARIELPQLALGCIDLQQQLDPAAKVLLRWQIVQSPRTNPDVAITGSIRSIPRLRPATQPFTTPVGDGSLFHDDRTYVITGGLSGLGLRTAAWMHSNGARHLVLLSRSGAAATSTAASAADWQQLQAGDEGVVKAMSCDIGDPHQVAVVFDQIRRSMPPLAGVVHAAGVLEDSLLGNQTAATIAKVWQPKLEGAFLLHDAVAKCDPPLELFAVYSSVAGVLGSAAQANYSAANAALDAFCSWRRQQGLAAVSLAWGPWAEVGLAARHGTAGRVLAHGLGELSPALAAGCLRYALAGVGRADPPASAPLVLVPATWDRWAARFPGSRSLLGAVTTARVPGQPPRGGFQAAAAAPSESAVAADRHAVRARVIDAVGELLGGDGAAGELDESTDLLGCGLDSLATMELRQGLSAELGVQLPVAVIHDHPELGALVSYIHEQLDSGAPSASSSAPVGEGERATPLPADDLGRLQWRGLLGSREAGALLAEKVAAFLGGGGSPVLMEATAAAATPDHRPQQQPLASSSAAAPHGSSSINSRTDGQSVTIVVGWAGASASQLAPVITWHRRRGRAVLVLMPDLLGGRDGEQLVAIRALPPGGDAVLHCFSNNAVFFLRRLLQADPQALAHLQLRGCILDSAPHALLTEDELADSGPRALAAHLSACFGVPPVAAAAASTDDRGGGVSGDEGDGGGGALSVVRLLAEAHWHRLCAARGQGALSSGLLGPCVLPCNVPRLCLYGAADAVVAPEAVRSFVESERARGERVHACEFGSGHVMHHLKHTEAYWATVAKFVEGVTC